MFIKYKFDYTTNMFSEFINSIGDNFETITNGRLGTNIVKLENDNVPIVRTTTPYLKPALQFNKLFDELVDNIKRISNIDNLNFNNGLVELYNSKYKKMKFHTDQSLDLVDESFICICSFYNNDETTFRKLVIQNKETNEVNEIILEPNTFIMFSTETNKKFVHKIILDSEWLGITLRLSKTFIKFIDDTPYFCSNNTILRLANDIDKINFMKLKGNENQTINFDNQYIDFTISQSDLLKPIII